MSKTSIFLCAALCAVYVQHVTAGECNLKKITDLDFGSLKASCSDSDKICDTCLKDFMTQVLGKSTDEDLKNAFKELVTPDNQLNQPVLEACAQPYAPDILMNDVFPSVADGLKLLDCPQEDMLAAVTPPLTEKGMADLLPTMDEISAGGAGEEGAATEDAATDEEGDATGDANATIALVGDAEPEPEPEAEAEPEADAEAEPEPEAENGGE